VLVKQSQRGGGLVDADEFVGAFKDIFRFLMRRRRLAKTISWAGRGDDPGVVMRPR